MSLSPRLAQLRQMAECDLLSGMVGLARYAKHGPPSVLGVGKEEAHRAQREVLGAIEAQDLSGGFASLWRAAEPLWREGKAPSLDEILRRADSREKTEAASAARLCWRHGMGIPLYAPVAARRILEISANLLAMKDGLGTAADAYEALESMSV